MGAGSELRTHWRNSRKHWKTPQNTLEKPVENTPLNICLAPAHQLGLPNNAAHAPRWDLSAFLWLREASLLPSAPRCWLSEFFGRVYLVLPNKNGKFPGSKLGCAEILGYRKNVSFVSQYVKHCKTWVTQKTLCQEVVWVLGVGVFYLFLNPGIRRKNVWTLQSQTVVGSNLKRKNVKNQKINILCSMA